MPVKFKLTGASAGITDAVARLTCVKVSNTVPGEVNEADAPGSAMSGNVYQYDAVKGQYYFNWSTKGLSAGTYKLMIDLGDGVAREVFFALK